MPIDSSTAQVLGLAFIAMIGTSISSTVTGVLAYLKSKDASEQSKKNEKSIERDIAHSEILNKKIDSIANKQEEQHSKTNGRLDELVEAIKTSAHAQGLVEGIRTEQDRVALLLQNANLKTNEIQDVWGYLRNRAIAELATKDLLNLQSGILSDDIKLWYNHFIPDLKNWYEDKKDYDDLQLFISCTQHFGERFVKDICEPLKIYNGACVELAIRFVKSL